MGRGAGAWVRNVNCEVRFRSGSGVVLASQSTEDRCLITVALRHLLAWALTPWKAQGMSLEKAKVRLGGKASSPGVALVAVSRVSHPDDLMLDDDFPSMSTIVRQREHPSFPIVLRVDARCSIFPPSHRFRRDLQHDAKHSKKPDKT